MRPPCEVVVKKILPAIRSILVRELTERHDFRQTEIADKLGITQPAVSQYMKSNRGASEIIESLKEANLYSDIQKLSDKIADETVQRSQIIKEYCDLCNSMGEKEILCTLHAKNVPYLTEEECELCIKARKGQI